MKWVETICQWKQHNIVSDVVSAGLSWKIFRDFPRCEMMHHFCSEFHCPQFGLFSERDHDGLTLTKVYLYHSQSARDTRFTETTSQWKVPKQQPSSKALVYRPQSKIFISTDYYFVHQRTGVFYNIQNTVPAENILHWNR